jgi:SRSO17 transposase
VAFATKPELAIAMLTRALDAGVPAGWVTADEVYGRHSGLRGVLEARGMPYVLAIASSQRLWADAGRGPAQLRADALAAGLPPPAWKRISAGAGAKGPRIYAWARLPIRPLHSSEQGFWLLVRRSLADPTDLAYYVCSGPADTRLHELARVAGTRWAIEETFQTGKGEVGLDQYQVRRYDGWYRHITLAMLAHAFLTVTRAAAGKGGRRLQPTS